MTQFAEGKIAASPSTVGVFDTRRVVVDVNDTDFTDIAAVVLSAHDAQGPLKLRVQETRFGLPSFAVLDRGSKGLADLDGLTGVLQAGAADTEFFGKQVETAAAKFDSQVLSRSSVN